MKAIGISEARNYAKYISIQCSYSLADRTPENELLSLCLDQGVGIIPYFPLAGGILTGKYPTRSSAPPGSRADKDPNFKRFLDDQRIELANNVNQIAEEIGTSSAPLSLAWLMHQPAVSTVIVGASQVEQLDHNLQSASILLREDTLDRLDQVSRPFRYGEPFAYYRLPSRD